MPKQIIAIGLLTEDDLHRLGSSFDRAFKIDETPCFGELLHAIDVAERALWRQKDAEEGRDLQTLKMPMK